MKVSTVKKTLAAFLATAGIVAVAAGDDAAKIRAYTPSLVFESVAHSYASPTLFDWNGDGLLDLVVGEKTAESNGKVRLYLNRGTATEPKFVGYTYIQKDGKDMEFPAMGCIGLQVSFGRAKGATMFITTSHGKIYGCNRNTRDPKSSGQQENWVLWFDHSTDARFNKLIRACTFCADMDGDGFDEVVASGQKSPMFWMKRSCDGDAATTVCTPMMDGEGKSLEYPEGQNHASAVMFDVTDDGVPDIVTGDTVGNVWVYVGQGDGRFAAVPVQIYDNPDKSNKRSRLAVGDLDGDGIKDILVGRQNGSVLMLKGSAKE